MATLGKAVELPGLSPHRFGEKHLASSFTPASNKGKKICLQVCRDFSVLQRHVQGAERRW